MIRAQFAVYDQPEEARPMGSLEEDNAIAKSLGLTYGKYKALIYGQEHKRKAKQTPQEPERRSKRQYTDEEAFSLWQAGKSDAEIGHILGVSRQSIQKWRDAMEIPSTAKHDVDTAKCHLIKTKAGMFVINKNKR